MILKDCKNVKKLESEDGNFVGNCGLSCTVA
jgi:hypothetical protein